MSIGADLDGFRVEIDASRERADIVLDRPPMNVVSMRQRDQLRAAFEALDEDARVRVIVLRAEGEHFSSGGYIKGFLEASPEHVSKLAWNIAAPARCSKPVIVANRGYAFGVGFEISLACDFRIVSETCRYALPEQKLGQIPGSGGSARLQKIIGITRTKDIVMRSKRITGQQALAWGIATECVPDAELEATVDALVDDLAQLIAGKAPEDFVFASPRGGLLRLTNFRPTVFDPAVRAAGLDGLTPHSLRHTAASLAITSGADVKVVQQMLGHASATMTLDLYGHLFAD